MHCATGMVEGLGCTVQSGGQVGARSTPRCYTLRFRVSRMLLHPHSPPFGPQGGRWQVLLRACLSLDICISVLLSPLLKELAGSINTPPWKNAATHLFLLQMEPLEEGTTLIYVSG